MVRLILILILFSASQRTAANVRKTEVVAEADEVHRAWKNLTEISQLKEEKEIMKPNPEEEEIIFRPNVKPGQYEAEQTTHNELEQDSMKPIIPLEMSTSNVNETKEIEPDMFIPWTVSPYNNVNSGHSTYTAKKRNSSYVPGSKWRFFTPRYAPLKVSCKDGETYVDGKCKTVFIG